MESRVSYRSGKCCLQYGNSPSGTSTTIESRFLEGDSGFFHWGTTELFPHDSIQKARLFEEELVHRLYKEFAVEYTL